MALFNIEIQILSDSDIAGYLESLCTCISDMNLQVSLDPSVPGVGALLTAFIRAFESGLITSFKPFIALVSVVLDSLSTKPIIKAPIVFLDKIIDVSDGIAELLSDPPISILEAIVGEVLSPLIDNINIPLPSIEGFIEILTTDISITDIDWNKWLDEGKLIIPDKLQEAGEKAIRETLQLFQVPINGLGEPMVNLVPFFKILSLVLFPVCFVKGLIQAVIDLVTELVTDLFGAISSIVQLISDPPGFLVEFMGDILAPVLGSLCKSFMPPGVDTSGLDDALSGLFGEIFAYKLGLITLDTAEIGKLFTKYESMVPALAFITPFIKIFICLIKWFFSLLTDVEKMLTMFLPEGFSADDIKQPPISTASYNYSQKKITMYNPESDGKAASVYKALEGKEGFQIQFYHKDGNRWLTAIISEVKQTIFATDPDGNVLSDKTEVFLTTDPSLVFGETDENDNPIGKNDDTGSFDEDDEDGTFGIKLIEV